MKIFFVTFCLLLSCVSSFAFDDVRMDTCTTITANGKRLVIKLENDRSQNPHVISDVFNDGDLFFVNYQNATNEFDVSAQKADLVLRSSHDDKIERSPFNDGCWIGQDLTFSRNVVVEKIISSKLQTFFGIEKGDRLKFSCRGQTAAPTGDQCDEPHQP